MKNFEIVDKLDELWIVNVYPATNFNEVAKEILEMRDSVGFGAKIQFEFSQVKMLATKESTIESLKEQYNEGLTKKHNEYVNSQEYKDLKDNSDKLSQKYQIKGKELLAQFDEALKNPSDLVKWIGEFSIVTDSTILNYNPKELAKKMKDNGFDYQIPDSIDLEYTAKELVGRGIIANAFIALSAGNNIHYVAASLANNYKQLEEKENVLSKIEKTRENFLAKNANSTLKNHS